MRGARRDVGVDEVAPEGVWVVRRRLEVCEGGGGGEVGMVGGAVGGDGLREG